MTGLLLTTAGEIPKNFIIFAAVVTGGTWSRNPLFAPPAFEMPRGMPLVARRGRL
jgi:hypothetical protein